MTDLGLKTVKIFADGADLQSLLELADQPHIAGFTTNPTLMRQSGVSDYEGFARKVLEHITDRPISFEVFADEHGEMLRQARLIASWGSNVYVKIPVTDTRGQSTATVIRELTDSGVQVNVTALMTLRAGRGGHVHARRWFPGGRLGVRRPRRGHGAGSAPADEGGT